MVHRPDPKRTQYGELAPITEKQVEYGFIPPLRSSMRAAQSELQRMQVPADLTPVHVPERTWQDVGVQPPQSVRMFRGVNTLDQFALDKGFATRAVNVGLDNFPALTVHNGVDAWFTPAVWTGKATGLTAYHRGSSDTDTRIHSVVGGTWREDGTVLATGLSDLYQWTFVNFKGNFATNTLLAANGGDTPRKWDGTTLSTWTMPPTVNFKFITAHDYRVYGSVGNKIYFSALNKAEDWTDADPDVGAGAIDVETTNGDVINGLAAGQGHMLVFQRSSVHELWGTNPSNYKLEKIADDIGLLNQNCYVVARGISYWMDVNGIYQYGGSRPRDISGPVKEYIKQMWTSPAACAGTDGTHLYFSLSNESVGYTDLTLEYHLDYGTWTVRKDITPVMYANSGTWTFGDYGNLAIAHYAHTANTTVLVYNEHNSNVLGSPISWEWVSAPFSGQSLSQRLRWYKLWLVADVPSGSTMEVFLSSEPEGDDAWVSVKTFTGYSGLKSNRVLLPLNQFTDARWLRIRLTGTGAATIHEIAYQQRELPML